MRESTGRFRERFLIDFGDPFRGTPEQTFFNTLLQKQAFDDRL